MRSRRSWTDEDLTRAVRESRSISDVLRALDLVVAGGNFDLIRKHIAGLGLDTGHFSASSVRLAALERSRQARALTYEEVFCENSRIDSKLYRHVRRHNVLKYVCGLCGNAGEHNGQPLVLQIDHRNGVPNDNRVENLRYLCPNCHSQTPTFAGRAASKAARSKAQ